ncbi:MAG TPA: LuxR C-terminal-related transcriptional regulator [Ktedonobacteraceae bacterium]|nr:LuxR C-terminal-related transcriptional regulator [Ktedonobacteraceae bacterium]
MMQEQLLTTKISYPPTHDKIIGRERLLTLLDVALQARLTLICAPAGYGKTTLLSAWAERQAEETIAWLTLDKEDDDPLSFWHYVLKALRVHLPLPKERGTRPLLALLINEVSARPGKMILLIDDYHFIQSHAIHSEMAFLIDHLPQNMHISLATRSEPPLPLARLRMRQQLSELRSEELRFISSEVNALLEHAEVSQLSQSDRLALEQLSEGWIAGLQLAILSLHRQRDPTTFIRTLTEKRHYIFDYLIEEVFGNLSAEQQTFLLETSILSRMSAPLCNALTGSNNAERLLDELIKANLFIIALDDNHAWYRYHHLLAGTLYLRLQQLRPALIPTLHQRAGLWYAEHGLTELAIEHALSGADFEHAGRLILEIVAQLLRDGESKKLRAWIERLPPDLVRQSHRLSLIHFWTLLNGEYYAEADRCWNDVQIALSQADAEERARFNVAFHSGGASHARYHKQIDRAIEQLRQALADVAPDDYNQRSYMFYHLAECYWLNGELGQAQQALLDSRRASQAGGYAYITAMTYLYSGHIQALRGQTEQARSSYEQTLRLCHEQRGGMPALASEAQLALARLDYMQNELERADYHLGESLRLSLEADDRHMQFCSSLLLAQLRLTQGQKKAAELALAQIEARPDDFDFFFPLNGFISCYINVQISLGNSESAGQTLDTLVQAQLSPLLTEDLHCARARLLIAQEQPAAALNLLQPLLPRVEVQGKRWSAIEILLLQTLVHQAQDNTTRAQTTLTRALSLAEPAGIIRPFLDQGESLLPLLNALRGTTSMVSTSYIEQLLARSAETAREAAINQSQLQENCNSALSERELEILRLIALGKTNQQIAEHLVIATSTVKTYIKRTYDKLGVSSRTQALLRARQLRLL